jgi:hypothetical protein
LNGSIYEEESSMAKTLQNPVSFVPVDQTPAVRAADAIVAPLRAQHAELEARIARYRSIEERPLAGFRDRSTEELNAQVSINSWRADFARATVALREAQIALAEARTAERDKIRSAIAVRKHNAISTLRVRLLAAREANEELRVLEVAEQDLLGEPVSVMNWAALAYSDSTFTSKLDEWLELPESHAAEAEQ